jgi:hypothetical protein
MKARLLAAAFGLLVASAAHAVTEIHFWHAMDGALGDELNALAQKFNASQSEFKVVPQLKGDYDTVLTELRNTALQGKDRPEIVQIVDVATQNAMMEKRFFRPVHQVMADAGERLDAKAYAPTVAIFYSDKGNLFSLPFNISTPVVFYNKDAFKNAGLDFNAPLKTWYNVQEALLAVQEKQTAKCGLTASYPAWTMLENVLAWHNEEFATRNNGYDGLNADLTFNTFLAMRHWSLMSSWVKAQIFSYSGRRNEGQQRFTSGECAMLVASSGSYANIARDARRLAPQHRPRRALPLGRDAHALLRRLQGRTRAHEHRRGQPVRRERQDAGGVQGRGQVPRLPVPTGSTGRMEREDRLPAAQPRGRRGEAQERLLRKQSRRRHRARAGDRQDAHSRVACARRAPRQLPDHPRDHRRGARAGLEQQEAAQGRARRCGQARQRAAAPLRAHAQAVTRGGAAPRAPRRD